MGLTLSIGSEARKLGGGDLRLKLLRKNSQEDSQVGGVRDLREKLAGSMQSQPMKKNPPRPKPEPEAVNPARRSVIGEALVAESKKVSDSVSRKKSQQKVLAMCPLYVAVSWSLYGSSATSPCFLFFGGGGFVFWTCTFRGTLHLFSSVCMHLPSWLVLISVLWIDILYFS